MASLMFACRFAFYLEAAATTAAEAAAGEAASTPTSEPRTTRTARCGRKDGARMRRHDAETVGERIGIELRTKKSAAIPVGRLGHDALKGFAPILFNAEGHGEGQEFFEHLRRFDHFVEAVGFDVIEKVFEAQDPFQGARALHRARGHEPAKGTNHHSGEDRRKDKWKRGHTETVCDGVRAKKQKNTNYGSR